MSLCGPVFVDRVRTCLRGYRPLGFDMEWRFYWSNGRTVSRRTALIQIGDDKIILLAQLSAMTRESDMFRCDQSQRSTVYHIRRFPVGTQGILSCIFFAIQLLKRGVQRVIESPDIVKLGVNIRGKSGPMQYLRSLNGMDRRW